jgi:twinkle protein
MVTQLMVHAAELHGWRTAVFSPEMPVMPFLRDKMRRIVGRAGLDMLRSRGRLEQIDKWIEDSFIFIDNEGNEDEDITLEWVMDRAEDAIFRFGIRMLVIDPWNEVEHAKRRDETMHEYIGRAIRMLRKFARKYNIAIFVIAHPTKDVASGGNKRVPGLYDIDGSAHWYNKPDVGIVVDRPNPLVPEAAIYVTKVRFEDTGEVGKVVFSFDKTTSRYELLGSGQHSVDGL